MNQEDIIIIGSGPAGLTAAIYAARARLEPLLFAGLSYGGQLMTTTEVENFPGFPEGITGPELMDKMIKQAERFGTKLRYEDVTAVDFSTPGAHVVTVGETSYQAKAVILATGSRPRKLGLPSEETYWGKGVSSCATCDGAFFRDKVVAVIGGGDSAMEEATFLTRFASKVYVVHRRDSLRASQIMADRALANSKIEFLWNTGVSEVVGDSSKVSSLKLVNLESKEESTLTVDGMFLAIGHLPNTDFLRQSDGKTAVALDEQGFVLASQHTHTDVAGVFVAGDVHDHHYQQAITAAGMGCMAALDAESYLAEG